MPIVAWPWGAVVVVDTLAWTVISLAAGLWAASRPLARLARDGPITRLHRWERSGDWYRRVLRVNAWKHLLPDAGAWFGGLPKRHLPPASNRRARLTRFAAESRRAELAHWWMLAPTPVFAC